MKELMIAVERVVRPVRANPVRKMKMRQELLAHLTSAYEEGLARLGNEGSALEQAVLRFGNPKDLTRDLQASVPFFERVLFTPLPGTKWMIVFDRCLEGKQGESKSRRMARWTMISFLSLFVLMAGPAVAIYQTRPDSGGILMAAELFGVAAGTVSVFLLCGYAAFQALSGALNLTAILRATVYAALTAAAPVVANTAILHWMLDFPDLYSPGAVGSIPLFSLLILGAAFAARFQAAAKRSREEWTKLEIGE